MLKKPLAASAAFSAFLSVAVVLTPAAKAADYPVKPVAMIVAYSPGGGTDTAARVIAKYIQPHLNQRLVIQNKPGAGGQIGFTALARAKNDGYKIGFINIPSIFMVKMLRDNVPYEMSDFEAVANIQRDPVVLTVKADSPLKKKNVRRFCRGGKKCPRQAQCGRRWTTIQQSIASCRDRGQARNRCELRLL